MKKEIQDFLESDQQEMLLELKPLSEYISIMEGLGYETDEFDSNGWQVDFWLNFKKDNEKGMIIGGSLWYGGYSLSKNKD